MATTNPIESGDPAERVKAAERQRDERLREFQAAPDDRENQNEIRRVRDEFERKRGEIALEFVKSTMPQAWWTASWLHDAINQWWFTAAPGSLAAENLRNVTKAMGRSPYADILNSRKRSLRQKTHRHQRVPNPKLHPSVALASVDRLSPVCGRLLTVVEIYTKHDCLGMLATWIYSGKKEPHDRISDPSIDESVLESDFNTLRAYFGAQLRRGVQESRFVYEFPELDENAPPSNEKVRLCNFLGKVQGNRPGRLAAMLVSERHDVAIREVENLASKERRYSPDLPDVGDFECPLDGEVFETKEHFIDHLKNHL